MSKHLIQNKPQSLGKDHALKATSVSGWIWSYLSMTMPTTINEPMVDGTILLDSQSKTLPGYTCVTFSSHVHLNFQTSNLEYHCQHSGASSPVSILKIIHPKQNLIHTYTTSTKNIISYRQVTYYLLTENGVSLSFKDSDQFW